MMRIKKLSGYFLRYIMAIATLTIGFISIPYSVSAASKATTLKELKEDLKELQAKKAANDKQVSINQSEKDKANKAIADAHKQIEDSEAKIAEAKLLIEQTDKEIEELKAKNEELMTYFQLMQGENVYLEFIMDSSSMTELIMRSDAVNQLVEYQQNKLYEMDELIKKNEQTQVDLKKYEKELETNITNYESKISKLDSSIIALADESIDINDEIVLLQQSIKNYESMGCKDNDILDVCAANQGSAGWMKPVVKGRINSLFGYRGSSFHGGIDIGVAEGTKVYSAMVGKVILVKYKTSCGGNKVYVSGYVNGKPYTTSYVHLLSINVKLNQTVDQNTIIGYSGGYSTAKRYGGYDSCSTGAHLHFSVSEGLYKSYSQWYSHLINPPGFPGKGAYFYSRTQMF